MPTVQKSVMVVALTMLTVLAPAADTSAAGGVAAVSPRTGTPYDVVYTCAAESATVRFTPLKTNPLITFDVFFDHVGKPAPSATASFDYQDSRGLPSWAMAAQGGLNTELSAIRIEDGYATDPSLVPVLTAPVNCPSYGQLARTVFSSTAPTRVLDTRAGAQTGYRGATPGPGSSIVLPVAGHAGVPGDAVAVALNVTATDALAAGFVQVLPTGRATPGSSSSLNIERRGQTIANTVIVPIGDAGTLTFFSQSGAELIADVLGYFTPAVGAQSAGRLMSLTPTRVFDTRPGTAVNSTGTKPTAGSTIRVDPGAGGTLVPKGQAAAVVIGLTATETDAPGSFQVAAGGQLAPGATSALNSDTAGQTIANTVIVPVASDGTFDLFTQAGAHLIVDVLGWFTNSSNPSSTTGLFVPLDPERVYDSRRASAVNPIGLNRSESDEDGRIHGGVAAPVFLDELSGGAAAVLANLTVTEASAPGYFQSGALGALTPGSSSTVNAERAEQTIANAAIVPIGRGVTTSSGSRSGIAVYTQSGGQIIVDLSGFFTT